MWSRRQVSSILDDTSLLGEPVPHPKTYLCTPTLSQPDLGGRTATAPMPEVFRIDKSLPSPPNERKQHTWRQAKTTLPPNFHGLDAWRPT